MDLSIRDAFREDYQELCDIYEEVDELHREALPHVFRKPEGSARSKEFIFDIIGDVDAALLVAECDDRLVGLLHIRLLATPDWPIFVPRRYAEICDIVVRRGHQGSGIGKALLETAHAWAHARGVAQVELGVWDFNRGAIAFYEKFGYVTARWRMWKNLSEASTVDTDRRNVSAEDEI